MLPLVSIIIPVYKAEKDLPKCIESCCNQTYQNIEIILVNDGSPDNCSAICHQYAAKDSRIKVIDKENTGVSDTRNIGMSQAIGEFIMFVDSDDWVEPEMLEEMITFQTSEDFDLTIAGMTLYRSGEVHSVIVPKTEILKDADAISNHLANRRNITYYRPPVVKLFKRSLIVNHQIEYDINLKISEDFLFVLNYLRICQNAGTLNKSFYNYNLVYSDEKSKHYDYQNVVTQWDMNLLQFHVYKDFFINMKTYDKNATFVNVYLLTRIRGFLTAVILADGDKKTILSVLKQIASLSEYKDLAALKYSATPDKIEKLILFCCKNKLWSFLYFCFKCKNLLYNKHVYK